MADINVERKSPSIWPWIIGLLVLALLIWAVAEMVDTGEDPEVAFQTDPAEEVQPIEEEPMIDEAGTPLEQIMASPADFAGQSVNVTGTVDVSEVPTDRGFWLTSNGERMLAIIRDQPQEEPKDINPGQTLRLTQAQVYTADRLDLISGELDDATRTEAEGQDAVLVVDESNIEISQAGSPQPGTTPAQTAPAQPQN